MSVQRAISEKTEVDQSWRKFKWLKTKIVDEDRQLCNDFNFTYCGEQVTTEDEICNEVITGISKEVPILLQKPPSSIYKPSIATLKENKNKTIKDLTLLSDVTSDDATSDDDDIVDFIRTNKKRNINSQPPSHHAGAKLNKKSKKDGQQFPISEGSQSQLPSHHSKPNKKSKKEKQQFPMAEESQSQSPSHFIGAKLDKMSKIEGQQFPIAEGSQSQLLSHYTGAKRNKNSKKEKFPMEEGKHQCKSLRYLVEIRDLLSKLVEVKDPEKSKFCIEKINNSAELDELEEVIKDDVQRKAFVSKLKNIGGVDMADCTRNILGV